MHIRFKSVLAAGLMLGMAGTAAPLWAEDAKAKEAKPTTPIEQGKEIAFDRKRGNCLACHKIADGPSPGTIGPPLVAMQQRYPDKAKLRAQIYDPTVANPNTVMPPFGKHGVLTAAELDKVVEFIHSL